MEKRCTKSDLRRLVLFYRKLLSEKIFKERNLLLLKSVKTFIKENNFTTIHVFFAIEKNKEPNIQPLLPWLFENNYEILASKTDFKKKTMKHFLLKKDTSIIVNKIGIPEPDYGVQVSEEEIDLILIPLTLADKLGHRIGYGGGYYDRLLPKTKALKVGLSLAPPVDSIIQVEKRDIPMNHLLTPYKTYTYG